MKAAAEGVAMSVQAINTDTMDVRFVAGEAYDVIVRGHRLMVDQPVDVGGEDRAPTPTELFVASLASCMAFYAGGTSPATGSAVTGSPCRPARHGFSRDGLAVSASFEMAADKPARVGRVRLAVRVPVDLLAERQASLAAVIAHCTVHNSLT
jgi:uncharacterized OsmC-like protein